MFSFQRLFFNSLTLWLSLKDGYLYRIPLCLHSECLPSTNYCLSVCIKSRATTQVLQTRWLKTRHMCYLIFYTLEIGNQDVTRNMFPWKLERKSPPLTPPGYLMPWQSLACTSWATVSLYHHAMFFLCHQMDALPWPFGIGEMSYTSIA